MPPLLLPLLRLITDDLPVDGSYPGWVMDRTYATVTLVVFNSSFAQATRYNTSNWFLGMQNLLSITGMKQYLNTSEVIDMSNMFSICLKLTSIDLSNFNTAKVTNMKSMFSYCEALTDLDVSSFNTDNVTDMKSMFSYCEALTDLDLSSFSTDNVTDMDVMFSQCSNLRTIDVGSGWSTESVTAESGYMFNNCTSLVGGKGTTYDANHTDKAYAHIDGGPSNPGYFTDKNAGLRGDVNGDNTVSIADVTALIDYLLTGNTSGVNLQAANCDLSGDVTISDVTFLIDFLLVGHW